LPAQLKSLGTTFLLLVILGGAGWIGTGVTRLFCSRLPGETPRCWLTNTGPLGRTYSYDARAIGAVDVERKAGSKAHSAPRFCVELLDRIGSERDIGCYDRNDAANAERDRLERYLGDATVTLYQLETSRSVFAYVMLVFGVAQFLVIAGARFARAGKLRARIDHAANELELTWTFLGLRRSARRTYPLDGVRDVRLELGPIYTWFPEQGARLAVAFHGRRADPVTRYLPQVANLREGVAEIRAELGVVDPGFAPRASSPAEGSSTARVKSSKRPAPSHEGKHARARRSFMKIFRSRAGALMLGAVLVYSAACLLVELWNQRSEGSVEIYADSRCLFDGATLLPGGNMRTSLEPGLHSVSVFNPDVPGNYEPLTFEVVRGRTTVVHCLPTRHAVVP
jgi:hypothetical protein